MASVAIDVGISTHRPRNSPGDILVDQVETFCMMKRPRVSDILTIKEMFYALVGKTESGQLRRISNAIGQNAYIPRQLALFMALQPIEVATPVLLCSPVLGERDFLAILAKCERSHAYIIARGHDLSARLVKQLLSIEDVGGSLKEILTKNESARKRFGKSDKADVAPAKTEPVQETPELVETNDNKAARKVFDRNKDLLRLARLSKEERAPVRQDRLDRPAFRPAALGQRLVALMREEDRDGFAHEIEAACGLNKRIVAGYVREGNAGTLASILFLLAVPHYTSARILLLICPKVGRDHSVFVRVMKEFSKLDRAAAIAYFKHQDNRFSLPTKQHHIIEAQPMFNALRRNRQRVASGRVKNTRKDIERLKAG